MNNDNNNQNDNRKNHTPECTLKSSIVSQGSGDISNPGEERKWFINIAVSGIPLQPWPHILAQMTIYRMSE